MKNFAKLLALLAVVLLAACTSASRSNDTGSGDLSSAAAGMTCGTFESVRNRNWNLVGLRTDTQNIVIDRGKLAAEGFGEIFTLRFGAGLISGVGAPNQYNGPFTLGEDQAVTIGMMASTMMAAFREPDELKEHEYYAYLHKTVRWNLTGGNLELYSSKEDGSEIVLIFAPAGS